MAEKSPQKPGVLRVALLLILAALVGALIFDRRARSIAETMNEQLTVLDQSGSDRSAAAVHRVLGRTPSVTTETEAGMIEHIGSPAVCQGDTTQSG